MKTQLRKPARSKASYTDQYKQEALELWRSSGRSAAKVAARGWLKCSAAQDDATPSPVSCVQRDSLPVSVPSIAWPQPTVVTVGRLRLTALKVSPSNDPTKSGPPTPLAFSPARDGCIWLRSWMSLPAV